MDRTEPRPGHRLDKDGVELYDVGEHILRAFENVPAGTRLTARQIREAGRRENIPASWNASMSAVVARLYLGPPDGVVVDLDEQERLCAYKREG